MYYEGFENSQLYLYLVYKILSACMFCFPNSDHVMLSSDVAFFLFYKLSGIIHVERTTSEKNILWGSITWI